MKLVLLAFSLVSSMAYACPNLTGNYVVTLEDGYTESMVVTQSKENNVTTYNVIYSGIMEVEMIADGVIRQTEVSSDDFTRWFEDTYICDGEKLVNSYVEKMINKDGSVSYEDSGVVTSYLDSNNDLFTQIESTDKDGNKEIFEYTYKRQ